MDDEIQLISDGDGIAVIGRPSVVERFLAAEGLQGTDLGLHRLPPALGKAAGVLEVGSGVAAQSGRWMKLTEESAAVARTFPLVQNSQSGFMHATARASDGKFLKNLQFTNATELGTLATNPALLSGAAGLMAQLAMQQAMDEITDYLATIDEKVDDVLRAQKDAVLADMIGVQLVIEEAMTVRAQVGRVSDVTWSKVQGTSMTIVRTQAYALRQLEGLAEKLEDKSKVGDLAKTTKAAEETVPEWLAVVARCFQLHDALAVLELDRLLEESPDDLDQHRLGLRTARQNRLEGIAHATQRLLDRMAAAAGTANMKVLLSPINSRAVVHSSNDVAATIAEFHGRLGIESEREALEARLWRDAAVEMRDKVLATGADGAHAARRLGGETLDRATDVFRATQPDGDGISDRPRARAAVEEAGSAIKRTTAGAAGAVSSLFRRNRDEAGTYTGHAGDLAAQSWTVAQPRYVVVLCHGYGEHIGRYDWVARTLNEHGASVYGVDHAGHGRSAGERVLITDYDCVVADFHRLVRTAKDENPGLPVVLIGHSMGGMIAARYLQLHGEEVTAAVLSGPVLGSWATVDALLALEEIPATPIDPATLSRDPAVGEAYAADPLVWHGDFKRPTLEALQACIDRIAAHGSVGDLPLLHLHGEDDQLVPIEPSQAGVEAIRGRRTEAKTYAGARHEIFNEINKEEVLTDVTAFIDRVLGDAGALSS